MTSILGYARSATRTASAAARHHHLVRIVAATTATAAAAGLRLGAAAVGVRDFAARVEDLDRDFIGRGGSQTVLDVRAEYV
jgi:hypothetical protein